MPYRVRCPGEGPYCPFCGNATADMLAHPDTFDIQDHMVQCRKNKEEQGRRGKR